MWSSLTFVEKSSIILSLLIGMLSNCKNNIMKRGMCVMFCRKNKRSKKEYSILVQQYLKENTPAIVQRLYDIVSATHELDVDAVKSILGENYPKAPWKDNDDIMGQFACILEEAGWLFVSNNGKIILEDEKSYSDIVQNHLKFSGSQILDRLSECCERTNGRITYWEMQSILGFHYPKAPYCDKSDIKACTILFLKETGIPFKFDNMYIYLP